MAASVTATKASRTRAPDVNLFDLPELMPGAHPSANPAQREEFEQRCRQLHRDEVSESLERAGTMRAASGGGASYSELEAMFPMLDAALVRTLASEAPTPQMAIETLLALSAAVAEPVSGGAEGSAVRAATPPPRNLGVEDHDKFPSLVDADGWQVTTTRLLERDQDEDLGSVWRDRAKAAKDIPAPRVAPAAPTLVSSKKKPDRQKEENDAERQPEFLTDYEFRQRAGQRRAIRRAQYGRGARGAGAAGRGTRPANPDDESESEEEEEEAGAAAPAAQE